MQLKLSTFNCGYEWGDYSLKEGIKQGIIGGVTAGLTKGLADKIGHGYKPGPVVGQMVLQGAIAELKGGKFKDGAISALASKVGSHYSQRYFGKMGTGTQGDLYGRTAVAMMFGGLASEATGGSFEDGAMNALFVHLFNDEADPEYFNPRDYGPAPIWKSAGGDAANAASIVSIGTGLGAGVSVLRVGYGATKLAGQIGRLSKISAASGLTGNGLTLATSDYSDVENINVGRAIMEVGAAFIVSKPAWAIPIAIMEVSTALFDSSVLYATNP